MRTLRGRLLAYFGVVVLVCTTLTVGVEALVLRNRNHNQAVAVLGRQADALAATELVAPGHTLVFTTNPAAALGGVHELASSRSLRVLALVGDAQGGGGQITLANRRLLYEARTTPGGGRIVLVRAAQLGPGDARSLLVSLILAGLGGAVVAGALALFLARRLTRPIDELARATEQVAQSLEQVRVPVEGQDELARLARAFNEMARELAESRRARRSFLLSVSHELRTPLTSIQGYAEGLEDGAVDPAEAGRVIAAEAARLERLIRDVLDLARLDRDRFSVAREPVDLHQLATRAQRLYATRASESRVELTVRADAAGAVVDADPDRLMQVVCNLLDNALGVTPPGGAVTLSVQQPTAGWASLSVSDTGPGIAPEDLPHAFERFYLHERSPQGRGEGSGLGLAIVAELAQAMDGAATVSSVRGEGARFTVALPAHSTAHALH